MLQVWDPHLELVEILSKVPIKHWIFSQSPNPGINHQDLSKSI